MKYDPHEPQAPRSQAFAKNEMTEDFLLAMNEALCRAGISLPAAGIRPERLPIIYIVGAPRSGTTLLSQVMSRYMPVGYINNLIARFWLKPSAGIVLSKVLLGPESRREVTFESTHGSTHGLANPHEFGYFWRHWLRLDGAPTHHLSQVALDSLDWAGLKTALENEILAPFGTPVVFKNIICGFHASWLTKLHPRSLFVYIERDNLDVAKSLLKSRMERYSSYSTWWSIKPSTYPFTGIPAGDAAAEVARQVIDCKREMEAEISRPGVSSIRVSYKRLCEDTPGVAEAICSRLKEIGFEIRPDFFDEPRIRARQSASSLPEELERRLCQLI